MKNKISSVPPTSASFLPRCCLPRLGVFYFKPLLNVGFCDSYLSSNQAPGVEYFRICETSSHSPFDTLQDPVGLAYIPSQCLNTRLNSRVLVSPSRNSHTHTSVDRALTLKLSWQLNLFSDSSSGGRMAPASCLLLKDNISSWHLPVKVGQGYDSWGVSGAQALFYFFKLLFIHFRPRVACGNLSSLKVKVLVTQLCLTLRPHRL